MTTSTTMVARWRDRRLGLPRGRSFQVTEHEITARDGAVLRAAHWAPTGHARGTVVVMTPYGRVGASAASALARYATQGYHLLAVSVRGTFGSGDTFDPMFGDGDDFRDAVAWMREQPWYTGSFATVGASYLGWTQWTLMARPEPDHRAAVVVVGPHDFRSLHWGPGSLMSTLPLWAFIIDNQERRPWRSMLAVLAKGRPVYRLLREAPVAQALFRVMPRQRAWLDERIEHDDVTAPYWAPLDLSAVLDEVDVPVLVVGGWQDLFLAQSVEQFTRLRARGVDAALTIGPWEHADASDGPVQTRETFEWLATHLDGAAPDRPSRVHLHVTGVGEWRRLDAWPPPTRTRRLHLGQHELSERPGDGEVTVDFDPADPPTFRGGPLLVGGGYVDDTAVAHRRDVLALDSGPLPTGLEVHGSVEVVLDHAARHSDCDIFVRLSDVDERGRSTNVAQGVLRVREDGVVRVVLHPVAHRFGAGHRLRLAVAGGAHPWIPASPGTGENPMRAASRVANQHRISLAGSYVDLPTT